MNFDGLGEAVTELVAGNEISVDVLGFPMIWIVLMIKMR